MRHRAFDTPFVAVVVVLLALSLAGSLTARHISPNTAAHPSRHCFIDPALTTRTGDISVIVTARHNSRQAANAVRTVGGRVLSDLWIINAVSATVNANNIANLAANVNVVSIIEDKEVRSADWNGWVSDDRVFRGSYMVATSLLAPPIHLPNGGFAAVTSGMISSSTFTSAEMLVGNPDGSEKPRLTLTVGSPFYAPVTLNPNTGIMYVLAAYGAIYAVSMDNQLLWQNASMLNTNYFVSGGIFGSDGTLYVVSYNGTLYALDPNTGVIRWQQTLVGKKSPQYWTSPVIGPDNTLYVENTSGDVFAVTSAGVRWSVALGAPSTGSPVLSGSTLYAAAGNKFVGLNTSTGAQVLSFTTDTNIIGSPAVAPDGGIIVTSATTLFVVAPTGQLQWFVVSPLGAFVKPSVISADGTAIYAAGETARGKKADALYAFRRNGAFFWKFDMQDSFVSQVTLDPDGGILVADVSGNVYRLDTNGNATNRLKAHATISTITPASDTGNVVVSLATSPTEIDFIGRLPNAWNGRKDVEPSPMNGVYHLTYPYTVDTGADILHAQQVSGGVYIRGGDVGVAVVDSGVYWDSSTRSLLGPQLQHQFIGQADFVQSTCPGGTGCTPGAPGTGYAFYDYTSSLDAYGHGTHVAGTISNKLTEQATGAFIGVAPNARILSARVLDGNGTGSYARVIQGIQYVVSNAPTYGIRVMNLSISGYATVPYFVDPLDRAVEAAWRSGIVVLAAAGNTGPFAQTITVPGNDPYVITVGAVNGGRTPGFWKDDIKAPWSATGPTFDGFPKPDILAPGSQIVSYMYNGGLTDPNTPTLVRLHPDYSANTVLFRMNGTSMATAVASGVAALMVQANPALTPNQVKYRLMKSAKPAFSKFSNGQPVFNTLQQGLGRIWAPDATLGTFDSGTANVGMDINADLAHGYFDYNDLAYHYQGPVRRILSADGTAYLYYATTADGTTYGLGATNLNGQWLSSDAAMSMIWSGMNMIWSGGLSSTEPNASASMQMIWSGTASPSWASMQMIWSGMRMLWSGMSMIWSGGTGWAGGSAWSSMQMIWSGSLDTYASSTSAWSQSIGSASSSACGSLWVDDNWTQPSRSSLPPPSGVISP